MLGNKAAKPRSGALRMNETLSYEARLSGRLDGLDDIREEIADDGTQQEQDSDHDDGHQYQDERILEQALALLMG